MVEPASNVQTMVLYAAPKNYVDIEQAKLVEQAKVVAKTQPSLGGDDKSDPNASKNPKTADDSKDYSSLMPKWMFAVASTYATLQQDNSPNSAMGQFIAKLQASQAMQEAFAKALNGASSFTMLKSFLDHDTYFCKEAGDVGISAQEMKDQLNNFKPSDHSDQQQIEQEQQSEFSAVMNQTSIVQDEGDRDGSTATALQNDAKTILSDGTNVDNQVEQVAESFGAGSSG